MLGLVFGLQASGRFSADQGSELWDFAYEGWYMLCKKSDEA